MFPGPFLTSTKPVHYPDTSGPVLVLFPYPERHGGKPPLPVLKTLDCHSRGSNPRPPAHKVDTLTQGHRSSTCSEVLYVATCAARA